MAKEKTDKKIEMKTDNKCHDLKCPFHGTLSVRGRSFMGRVIRKFPKRVVIELERTIYIQKYERYAKSRTRLHARLSDCLAKDIEVGDYIEVKECRPLSKIIKLVAIKKIDNENTKEMEVGQK